MVGRWIEHEWCFWMTDDSRACNSRVLSIDAIRFGAHTLVICVSYALR